MPAFLKLIFISAILVGATFAAPVAGAVDVPWRKTGMEAALKEAKDSHKPLLVYWGAIWCPPCNALKAKAFHEVSFVKAVAAFVPVYLDGDSEEAQTWGERLKASGYPTLLALNSDGVEIQRFDVSESLSVLISQIKTAGKLGDSNDALLEKATGSSPKLTDDVWRLLASRDWQNDERWRDHEADLSDKLQTLAKNFPTKMKTESLRVRLTAMDAKVSSLKDSATLPKEQREEWLATLRGILQNPATLRALSTPMSYDADDFVKAIFPGDTADAARDAFVQSYLEAFRKYHFLKGLSMEERLNAVYPFVLLSSRENKIYPPVAEADAQWLKAEVDSQLKAADTPEKLTAVLGTLGTVYADLGQPAEGERLVIANLDRLPAKNEMMSVISDLEDKQGHSEEALKWSERAYRESLGGATRLQWGLSFVKELIKRHPQDHDRIESESNAMIADSLKRVDTFSGRNWRSLKRLNAALKDWAKAEKIQSKAGKVVSKNIGCTGTAPGSEAATRCEGYVKDLETL